MSAGPRIAIGVLIAAAGIGLVVLGVMKPGARMAAPAGLCFAFGGAIVLVPPGARRVQLLLVSLMVSSLAALFDWVAFGPGERQFIMSGSIGTASVAWKSGEEVGRIFFGLFALLFDIAAVGLWLKFLKGSQ
jgi:hypothetical protein